MIRPFTTASYRFAAAAHRREADTRRASPLACQREFAAVLDTWAINADLRALEAESMGQPDLFGMASRDHSPTV